MIRILVWLFTLSLLFGGIGLFYYAVYYFFDTIGLFIFIVLSVLWLVVIRARNDKY
jgi:hypothetical protein